MSSRPAAVSFLQALRFWGHLGLVSFGGPAGQIAIMHQELVERRHWISERRFLHALNYCMVLPGPEAQQLATYIGWLMHRNAGGLMAGGLFVLPSLVLLIGLSWVYAAFGHLALVAGIFYGVKPAVTAIVLQAAHRIGKRTLRNSVLGSLALAAFVGIFFFDLPFPLIVLVAAALGVLGGRWRPRLFQLGGAHGGALKGYGPALIDDDTPSPLHARPDRARLTRVVLVGAACWLLPMLALRMVAQTQPAFLAMGWFFSKAALLTFGGAYAVLPYVYQGAVSHFAWLSAGQMIDGLALGETTPGPLIMVVAFVGFMAGYAHALLGPDQLFLAGALAAVVVTWFTFLPSFVFVLAGGPLVEASRDSVHLTAPLTAITAAVVGVIVNLALFFALHVLWPTGTGLQVRGVADLAAVIPATLQRMDGLALVLMLAAALALLRFGRSVPQVILTCAALGAWGHWLGLGG